MLIPRTPVICFAAISDGENISKKKKKAKKASKSLRLPVSGAKVPFLGFVNSLTFKQLICGSVAGGVSSIAASPFAVVKTKLLARRGGNTAREVVWDIARKQGLRSLLPSGITPWLLGIFVASLRKGMQFVTYEAVKRSEERRNLEDPKVVPFIPREVSIATLSGALSGVAALLATYPFNTIQDRLILQSKEYPSAIHALVKVIQQEGVRGLYRGLGPELARMVPSGAAEFYVYETLRAKLLDKASRKLGSLPSLVVGAAAGAFSTALTYPLELVRKEMSMSAVRGTGFSFNSALQAFRVVAAREGLQGLYKGVELELLQIVPNMAVSFLVYEIMKRVLIARNEEQNFQAEG